MFVTIVALSTLGALPSVDADFVRSAAQANQAEIEMGRLAVQKGSTPEIRQLGQTMIDDHSKVGDQLRGVAHRENFTLPTRLTFDQRSIVERLNGLEGAEFDRAYVDQMKINHQSAISLFQNEADNGINPRVKNFARVTLPSLHHHQEMVNRNAQKL
jgi:putative membrane protein